MNNTTMTTPAAPTPAAPTPAAPTPAAPTPAAPTPAAPKRKKHKYEPAPITPKQAEVLLAKYGVSREDALTVARDLNRDFGRRWTHNDFRYFLEIEAGPVNWATTDALDDGLLVRYVRAEVPA